jgi:hypothetical protein
LYRLLSSSSTALAVNIPAATANPGFAYVASPERPSSRSEMKRSKGAFFVELKTIRD